MNLIEGHGSVPCGECERGRVTLTLAPWGEVLCPRCHGRGWIPIFPRSAR